MGRYIDADALMDRIWQVCGEEDTEIEKGRVKWDSGLWLRYKVFEETQRGKRARRGIYRRAR